MVTTNALVPRLGAVTVADVTGTRGPDTTHVEVEPSACLTGRERSFVNVTGLHTVPKGELRRYRGRLAPPELDRLGEALKLYLDLDLRA